MKVIEIKQDSIVDGEGLRTVIFFSGCPHFCPGCHNPKSWNVSNGYDYTVDQLLEIAMKNPLNDITFSGGDPFMQAEAILPLAKALKAEGKNIWAYTGYTLEQLVKRNHNAELELLLYIDVLVDGPFIQDLKDLSLLYRGSSNQRIIEEPSLAFTRKRDLAYA
ncbi:MAG: anaerobic ribonucleoside-triphosphate reductase activating protein [Bacillaceae bacterium]|nr:anaerobic ribonucleoside-triphosphate reductase activating protein [Bacillaceae bacterium]